MYDHGDGTGDEGERVPRHQQPDELLSDTSQTQLDRLHAVPGPAGHPVELTGIAQTNRDSVHAITSRLPAVLGLIAVITFGLLFLLTGSVVLPVRHWCSTCSR